MDRLNTRNILKRKKHKLEGIREYNWRNINILHWASWADYIEYMGLTSHMIRQCGTIPNTLTAPRLPAEQAWCRPIAGPLGAYSNNYYSEIFSNLTLN